MAVPLPPAGATLLTSEGSEIVASSPEDFGRFLVQDMARFAELVRKAGIQPIE